MKPPGHGHGNPPRAKNNPRDTHLNKTWIRWAANSFVAATIFLQNADSPRTAFDPIAAGALPLPATYFAGHEKILNQNRPATVLQDQHRIGPRMTETRCKHKPNRRIPVIA